MTERDGRAETTRRSGAESDSVELVLTAAEAGYFEVPREVSLAELADREGISDVTASERLRRGIGRFVADSDG